MKIFRLIAAIVLVLMLIGFLGYCLYLGLMSVLLILINPTVASVISVGLAFLVVCSLIVMLLIIGLLSDFAEGLIRAQSRLW